jgi:hypothetical protein
LRQAHHRVACCAFAQCGVLRLRSCRLQFPVHSRKPARARLPGGIFLSRLRSRVRALCRAGRPPVDVLFVGGYSRHYRQRAAVLEAMTELEGQYNIAFHLDRSRLCALAELPLGYLLPLGEHRRPGAIRAITKNPVFGLDYCEALSAAKIVLNGAIDMAGADRGNMRCFAPALGRGKISRGHDGRRDDCDLSFALTRGVPGQEVSSGRAAAIRTRAGRARNGGEPLFQGSAVAAFRSAGGLDLARPELKSEFGQVGIVGTVESGDWVLQAR